MNSKTVSHAATIGRRPQRWAKIACWAAFCSVLPSATWRLAMLVGVDTGFMYAQFYRDGGAGTAYVLRLEAIQLGAAALCLGLCHSWGERVPRWVPGLGGRVIPRPLPVVVGGLGDALLYVIIGGTAARFASRWLGIAEGLTPTDGMSPGAIAVLALAYAPMLIWPVALTVALVGYWKRRAPRTPRQHRRTAGAGRADEAGGEDADQRLGSATGHWPSPMAAGAVRHEEDHG
ncbi:hypothetical protein [Propionibacterium australiense]|uniref:hypothetical protein n=1 Tax=Propionibacterium australiense TaxID=119981 RepID=UPI001C7DADCD|nr:hypothetical protein [Propionibacterium australiense]